MNFCVRLAKQLLADEFKNGYHQNFVVSPLSLTAIFNMVTAGSNGRTLEQTLRLHGLRGKDLKDCYSLFQLKQERVYRDFADMMGLASSGSCPNGVWVDNHFSLTPFYQEIIKNKFAAEAKNVDFKTRADEIVKEANSWAENATKGLIKDALQRGNINSNTRLLLGNALYFKRAWVHGFSPKGTEKRDFYLLNGDKVLTPFMTCKNFYESFDGFKLVKIPYQQGAGQDKREFAMLVFLPDDKDGLQTLLTIVNPDPEFLDQQFKLRDMGYGEICIPKFKFSYSLEASRAMKEMGLTLPFNETCTELTEMVHLLPIGVPFHISQIIQKAFIEIDEGTEAPAVTFTQKAFIEIDEEGTEAAAVTSTTVSSCSRKILVPKTESFVADHPFMFLIREEISSSVIFAGVVFNPSQDDPSY